MGSSNWTSGPRARGSTRHGAAFFLIGITFRVARDPAVMKRLLEPARIALAFFNADRAAVSFGIDLFDLDDEVQGAAQD